MTDAEHAARQALGSLDVGVAAAWWHRVCRREDAVSPLICELLIARLAMGEERHPGRWRQVNNLTEALEEAIDGIAYLCMAYGRRREPPVDLSGGYWVDTDQGWRAIGEAIDAQIAAAEAMIRAIETCGGRA